MRLTPLLLAALVAVLVQPAEARRGRGGATLTVPAVSGHAAPRPRPAPEGVRAGEAAGPSGAPAAALRPTLAPQALPAAAAPTILARPAEAPWCPAGRVVGGFCVVN